MYRILSMLVLLIGFTIANAAPKQQYSYTHTVSPATCPAPVMQMLVKCPSRYEVTTRTTSCKKFVPVDVCAGR